MIPKIIFTIHIHRNLSTWGKVRRAWQWLKISKVNSILLNHITDMHLKEKILWEINHPPAITLKDIKDNLMGILLQHRLNKMFDRSKKPIYIIQGELSHMRSHSSKINRYHKIATMAHRTLRCHNASHFWIWIISRRLLATLGKIIILKNAHIIMTMLKIEEDHLVTINLRNAGTLTIIRNVRMVISVIRRTTVLKNSIIQISIKPNSVHLIWMVRKNVNMVNFVPSHILRENSLLSLLRNSNQIWISISFISKRYGVLIEKMIMKEMFVSMLTTGKIIEESPQFSIIQRICVKIGILKIS